MNTTTGLARLTKDPELRTLPGTDTSVLELRLAVRKSRPRGKGPNRTTSFFDAAVFGPYAEALARNLTKGSRIHYRGEFDQQEWEKDGERRSRYVLLIDQVEYADPRKDGDDTPDGPEDGDFLHRTDLAEAA